MRGKSSTVSYNVYLLFSAIGRKVFAKTRLNYFIFGVLCTIGVLVAARLLMPKFYHPKKPVAATELSNRFFLNGTEKLWLIDINDPEKANKIILEYNIAIIIASKALESSEIPQERFELMLNIARAKLGEGKVFKAIGQNDKAKESLNEVLAIRDKAKNDFEDAGFDINIFHEIAIQASLNLVQIGD